MNKLVKKSIRELKPYIVDKRPIEIILNANESPYNIFPQFKDEFLKRIGEVDLNRYPDTDSEDLCVALSKTNGVQKENIICGNGSDEIIQIIINSFVDREDAVIISTPTFAMYGIFSSNVGGKVVEVPSKADFTIDTDEMIKQAVENSAKIIFLCSPNNPTGTLIPRKSILRIIEETSSIIVVDEAYGEFCNETVIEQIENPRVIILHTFSKAFAMAGARLGYGVAHRDTIEILNKVKAPYNLNVFSQVMGLILLKNQDIVKSSIGEVVKERDRVIEELRGIQEVEVYPSKANFVLIRSKRANGILEQCRKQGIGIRSFSEESPLKNCIRISIGKVNENTKVIDVIKEQVRDI